MSDWRSWPLHVLTTPPRSSATSILIPAWSQRVVLSTVAANDDVLLEAAAGLRAAGLSDPREQSRLLGLPVDLLEYLLDQVTLDGSWDHDGGRGPARWSSTLFRSYEHGRVLGRDVERPRPAQVEYSETGWPRTILEGTRGDPVRWQTYAVPPATHVPEPPPLRATDAIGALRRWHDGRLQVTPVGHPTPVLLCAFVSTNMRGEPTVLDPVTKVIDLELTEMARRRAEDDERLRRWLRPRDDRARGPEGRTAQAVAHLRELDRVTKNERLLDADASHALSRALRELLVAIVDTLAAVLPTAPTPTAGTFERVLLDHHPAVLAAEPEDPDGLGVEVRRLSRSLEQHQSHPVIGRISPTDFSKVASLTLGAGRDLDPRRGLAAVVAAKQHIVRELFALAELVEPLEEAQRGQS